MRKWVIKVVNDSQEETILFGTIYTDKKECQTTVEKLNEIHKNLNYHYSLIELVDVENNNNLEEMSTEQLQEREQEILEISNDMESIIDYDEWSAREYGETRVDFFTTALNLYNAGYRKVKDNINKE